DQKAADYLRQLRWPNGVQCPRCRSDAVESRERCDNGLQRFNCEHCAVRLGQQFAMFTDWTRSIFEESKLCPRDWLLVIGLWQLKLNATEIAAAADIQERTAQRCSHLLDGGIYETYHLDPTRQLEHQVEADACYQSAGSKGLAREVARCERAPRQRGIQLRGRATAATGRPPILGLVQWRDKTNQDAPAAPVSLEVLEHVRTATLKPIIAAKVKVGAQCFTEEYNIYHFTKADYDHRTVNHGAGEYARRDPDGTCVHCNTMEGLWSSLRNFSHSIAFSPDYSPTREIDQRRPFWRLDDPQHTRLPGHHAPKARASDGLDSVQSGLSAAIRHTAAWQPPRADNHRLALDPLGFRVLSQGLRRQTYPS